MRILLIEDDPTAAQGIELMLTSERWTVCIATVGEEGIELGTRDRYDIILLDLGLPDVSGFEVLRALRVAKIDTPILILSGLDGIENKVRGLGIGADDYVTKPFHKDELIARMQAIVRRSKAPEEAIVTCGDLTVRLGAKRAFIGDRCVPLTSKEYQMLEILAIRQGATITKEMFLAQMYGGMDEPELKIIDVFMCKLRRKLADASGGKDYVETIWGRGYILREPQERRVAV